MNLHNTYKHSFPLLYLLSCHWQMHVMIEMFLGVFVYVQSFITLFWPFFSPHTAFLNTFSLLVPLTILSTSFLPELHISRSMTSARLHYPLGSTSSDFIILKLCSVCTCFQLFASFFVHLEPATGLVSGDRGWICHLIILALVSSY